MAKLTSTDIYGSLLVQGNTEILGSLKVGNVDVALKTELPVNATASTYGLIKLGSDTVQSVAGNSVSSVAGKSYLIQKNSAGQLLVNVPWTDTQTTLPSFYDLAFRNNVDTLVDTYKPASSSKTLKGGTNIDLVASSNVISINAKDLVTTDTDQIITGQKTFTDLVVGDSDDSNWELDGTEEETFHVRSKDFTSVLELNNETDDYTARFVGDVYSKNKLLANVP